MSEELEELEQGITETVVPLPYLKALKLRQEEMLVDLLDDEYVEDHNISIDWEEAGKQFIDDLKMTVRSSGKHSIIKGLAKDHSANRLEEGDLLDFNLDIGE